MGEYYIQASVASPYVNVLCANMSREELAPMVITEWPGYNGTAPNATSWPTMFDIPVAPSWLNKTVVDDLFGFGEKYGRRHPVFPKLPVQYNTVTNITGGVRTDSMYILTAPDQNKTWSLCSLRSSMTPVCSSEYNVTMSGGSLNTICTPNNPLAYGKSHPEATSGVYNPDWVNLAQQWALATSLDSGLNDGMASNSRLLSQLVPTSDELDPTLPSIAEAIAMSAGCTLVMGTLNSPFIHTWNYSTTTPTLDPPQYQSFNATLRTQDYASGGTQRWQGIFYVVLFAVFITNVSCLVWFIWQRGLITDWVEPQNLFALSLNSQPSQVIEGSCGGGPEDEQFRTNWHITMDERRGHFEIGSRDTPSSIDLRKRAHRRTGLLDDGMDGSPLTELYTKLSKKRSTLL